MVTRKQKPSPAGPRLPSERTPVPLPRQMFNDFTSSLFDSGKPGSPVVRPNDMAALRIELVNLTES